MRSSPAAFLAVPVGPRDHVVGPPDAPVTLVEYGDYECPHCGRAHPVVHELLERLGHEVRFCYRHFPLATMHPHAQGAAEAAEGAGAQGRYWDMHDMLFENQRALVHEPDGILRSDGSEALNPRADLGHDDEHEHEYRCCNQVRVVTGKFDQSLHRRKVSGVLRKGPASIARRSRPGFLAGPQWLPAASLVAAMLAGALAHAADERKTEADLDKVRADIEELQKSIRTETTERDALVARLRDAEVTVAGARKRLDQLRAQRRRATGQNGLHRLPMRRQQAIPILPFIRRPMPAQHCGQSDH